MQTALWCCDARQASVMKGTVAPRRTFLILHPDWFGLMGHGVVASHFDVRLVVEAAIFVQVKCSRSIEQRGIINLTVQYFIVYTALAVHGDVCVGICLHFRALLAGGD